MPATRATLRMALLAFFVFLSMVVLFAEHARGEESLADDINRCRGAVDNPHYSSNANGVIVGARFWCYFAGREIYPIVRLYWCGEQQPQKSEAWLQSHCSIAGQNFTTVAPVPVYPNEADRYAPPVGTSGAHLRGWYSGCATWFSYYSGTYSDSHTLYATTPYYHQGGNVQPAP